MSYHMLYSRLQIIYYILYCIWLSPGARTPCPKRRIVRKKLRCRGCLLSISEVGVDLNVHEPPLKDSRWDRLHSESKAHTINNATNNNENKSNTHSNNHTNNNHNTNNNHSSRPLKLGLTRSSCSGAHLETRERRSLPVWIYIYIYIYIHTHMYAYIYI